MNSDVVVKDVEKENNSKVVEKKKRNGNENKDRINNKN